MGVVIDISGIYYTIGTSKGIINRKYSRGEFELLNGSTFLNASNIPKHEISMHTLAKSFSLGRRNSYQCKGKCTTDHCSCKTSGYPCTSSCHSKVRGKCNNSSTIMQLSTKSKLKKAPSILPEIYRNQYDKEHSSINKNLTNTKYLEVNSSDCQQQESMETVDKNRESWFYIEKERMCVSLGGDHQGINLCNTCSIDNFLTLRKIFFYLYNVRVDESYKLDEKQGKLPLHAWNVMAKNIASIRRFVNGPESGKSLASHVGNADEEVVTSAKNPGDSTTS